MRLEIGLSVAFNVGENEQEVQIRSVFELASLLTLDIHVDQVMHRSVLSRILP